MAATSTLSASHSSTSDTKVKQNEGAENGDKLSAEQGDGAVVAPQHEPEAEYVMGIKLYLILLGVTLVVFLFMLDQTIVVTAIPVITSTFNSVKDVGWYGSAFLLAVASMQPLAGKFYQFYSSKYIFLSALALFELGSLICAVSKSSPMFIVGRAIAGVGGSGLITGMLSIIAASAPLHKRPLYLGLVMGMASLGLVLGPILGGVLSQHASWRWCFYLNLPVGAMTFVVLLFIRIPDSKIKGSENANAQEQVNRLDLPGFVIFVPACTMLLLAFEWGGVTYKWKSATIIGLFCGSVATSVIFTGWESYRGKMAMIPLFILKKRVMISAAITTILASGSLLSTTYYLPIWFQVVLGVSPTMSGVYFMPSVGSQVLSSVLTGALTSRTGYYTPFAVVGCALTAISSGVLSTLTPNSSKGFYLGIQVLWGASRGLTVQEPLVAIQAILAKDELAVGNAFLMFAQLLGGAVFVSLAQTILANQLGPALAVFAPEVDVEAVLSVGATNFESVVSAASVPGVILAYNRAITRVFYMGASASAISFITVWGLGWTNLRTKKAGESKEKSEEEV